MPANPIRLIGSWGELTPQRRRDATTRSLDKIFDAVSSIIVFTQLEGFPAHEAAARVRLTDRAS